MKKSGCTSCQDSPRGYPSHHFDFYPQIQYKSKSRSVLRTHDCSLHHEIYCTRFDKFFCNLVPFSINLQGRTVTLRRFFDSDQKQIKKIYWYQIQLEIGLNSLYSSDNDSGRQPVLLTLFLPHYGALCGTATKDMKSDCPVYRVHHPVYRVLNSKSSLLGHKSPLVEKSEFSPISS